MSKKQCGLVDDTWVPPARIQDGLSFRLKELGFHKEAEMVLTEGCPGRLKAFAGIIVRTMPQGEERDEVIGALETLCLI